jgi:hypothetical protein
MWKTHFSIFGSVTTGTPRFTVALLFQIALLSIALVALSTAGFGVSEVAAVV